MTEFNLYFDGACEPKNPGGHMGYGYIIYKDDEYLLSNSFYEAEYHANTNNLAEYKALEFAMKGLLDYINNAIDIEWVENNIDSYLINVYGDSQLVIRQMSNEWKIKSGSYVQTAHKVKDLIKNHFQDKITLTWIPREQNKEADEMSVRELKNRNINRTKR